jgi:hypothetical protein
MLISKDYYKAGIEAKEKGIGKLGWSTSRDGPQSQRALWPVYKLKMKAISKKQYLVHSLERGLDLIEILSKGEPHKSLTNLSELAGFI